MRTVTYDYVKGLVEARIGSSLTGEEEGRFKYLLNDAIRGLYDRSDYWPRFLTVEPRTVSRGYIADEEDSIYVYGAGTAAVNGLYVRNGSQSGLPKYTLYDTDGTTVLYNLQAGLSGGIAWAIYDASNNDFYTYVGVTGLTPPSTGWEVTNGTAPAPVIRQLGKIERIIWQWDGKKWASNPSLLSNYRDSTGIRSTNGPQDGIVWVAYKAQLDDTYGDGTGGTVSDIPYEFSRYAALQVRYDIADGERQSNASATYAPSYRQVSDAADDALMGMDREGAMNTIKNIHRTYYNYDVSI